MRYSAILAQVVLDERLNILGVTGIIQSIAGTIIVVLHVPEERKLSTIMEAWSLVFQPGAISQ